MKVLIENYRGFDILFDPDKETFFANSEEHDFQQSKKSFAAAKTYVDEFIKENIKFKPFFVQRKPSIYSNSDRIKIIGIRKDKRFITEDEKGNKGQISDYSEKDYMLINSDNDSLFKQLEDCGKRIKEINQEAKEIESKIIIKTLADIKPQFVI